MNEQEYICISVDEIIETIEKFRNYRPKDMRTRVFTSGTGIPDNIVIDAYKDTGIIVVTRDGCEYLNGEKIGRYLKGVL